VGKKNKKTGFACRIENVRARIERFNNGFAISGNRQFLMFRDAEFGVWEREGWAGGEG